MSRVPRRVALTVLRGDRRSNAAVLPDTGYSTALACERLGGEGSVTSVEVDSRRLDQAASALFGAGYGLNLAVADGLYGYRPFAPYDRINAALSVRAIPDSWPAQTRPGGKILTTLGGWLYGYAPVLLTVRGDGTADGPLLPGTISFMAARTQSPPALGNPAHWAALTRDAGRRAARHHPDRLDIATAEGAFGRFLAQLAVPNAQLTAVGDTAYVIDVLTGSAAAIAPSDGGPEVRQTGPVRLWDAIEETWDRWDDAGRPGPGSFRMYVEPGSQRVSHRTHAGLSFDLPLAR